MCSGSSSINKPEALCSELEMCKTQGEHAADSLISGGLNEKSDIQDDIQII